MQWRWDVGYYSGEVDIRLELDPTRTPVQLNLVTDPDLNKLTRKQYDMMTQQIMHDTFALLSLSSFRFRVGRGISPNDLPVARLEYLRSRLAELEQVIRRINRNPVRVLRAEMDFISIQKAKHITGPELARAYAHGQLVKAPALEHRLPPKLKGNLPLSIYKARKTVGLNIPEHQDMKSALRSWATWLAIVAEKLNTDQPDKELRTQQRRWAVRCDAMATRLNNLLSLPLFEQVSLSNRPVQATQIYRRVPIYGRFLRIYSDMRRGIANLVGDFLRVPLARTFELYEIWAFLRMARAASIMYPQARVDLGRLFRRRGDGVTVTTRAACLTFGPDLRLCFKKPYREYWRERGGRGSYSRRMVPDFSLEPGVRRGNSSVLMVLDAKYRIDHNLNDALSSIHMYRDALVRETGVRPGGVERIVTGAYLITPDRLGPSGARVNSDWKRVNMPARLFHPIYRERFRFGAITMRPGISDRGVIILLRKLIADCIGRPVRRVAPDPARIVRVRPQPD